jgi:hypothetical protein
MVPPQKSNVGRAALPPPTRWDILSSPVRRTNLVGGGNAIRPTVRNLMGSIPKNLENSKKKLKIILDI